MLVSVVAYVSPCFLRSVRRRWRFQLTFAPLNDAHIHRHLRCAGLPACDFDAHLAAPMPDQLKQAFCILAVITCRDCTTLCTYMQAHMGRIPPFWQCRVVKAVRHEFNDALTSWCPAPTHMRAPQSKGMLTPAVHVQASAVSTT